MKIILLALLVCQCVVAENFPRTDEEFFRMMRAKKDAEQMEAEFKNPKKPQIGKNRAVKGNRSAPIVLVEYSDFQCPYCKKGYETVEELKKRYKEKLLFVFKHLPLGFHPLAMPAAKRFEAIAMQSAAKAYAFHDTVFKEQEKLASEGEAFLDSAAKRVGADVAKMKKDMDSDMVKKNIEADAIEAQSFGISGTPGFVLMGITLKGAYPIDSFEEIIKKRTAK